MNFTPEQLGIATVPGHIIYADFTGADLTSNLGPLPLRGTDRQIGLAERINAAVVDFLSAHGALCIAHVRPTAVHSPIRKQRLLFMTLDCDRSAENQTSARNLHYLTRLPASPFCVNCVQGGISPATLQVVRKTDIARKFGCNAK